MATVFTFDSESDLERFLNGATLPITFGVIGKGGKFTLSGLEGGVIVSPEAQAVLDRISGNGGTVDATEEAAIIDFVDRETLAGRWPTVGVPGSGQIDEFMFLGFQDAVASDVGWLLSVAVNTDVTHVPGVGKTYNGTTSFSDTKFNPAAPGQNFVLDDALFGFFVQDIGTNVGSTEALGALTSSSTLIRDQVAGRGVEGFLNSNAAAVSPVSLLPIKNDQLTIVRRESSSQIELFYDGISVGSTGANSQTVTNLPLLIASGGGQFYNGTISSFIAGAAIGFDQSAHFTSFETFLTDVGVLP